MDCRARVGEGTAIEVSVDGSSSRHHRTGASPTVEIGQYSLVTVSDALDFLAQGEEALRSARWIEARDAFEASLTD